MSDDWDDADQDDESPRSALGRDWEGDDLVIQSSDMALMNVASLAHSGALDLSPRFQRRNRWERPRQSRLMESFLLNIPVPPVYLAEDRRGRFTVIDGKQRLTAISKFLNSEYRLIGLEYLPQLEGVTFEDLPPSTQSTLNMRPLRAVTIMRQTPEWMKYEVFLRLNTGGQPLNYQEIRNVAFPGPLNDAIIDTSEDPFLHRQLKIRSESSSAYALMTDVTYVLRFLALSVNWRDFNGNLQGTLDRFMLEHHKEGRKEVHQHIARFRRSLRACQAIWADNAFKRFDGRQWRDQLIGGVYDAQMIACQLCDDETLQTAARRNGELTSAMAELFKQPDFDASVRIGTNNPAKLRYRVQTVYDMLVEYARL